MKKIIMGLLLVSLCSFGCMPPHRQYQGDWHKDMQTMKQLDEVLAFHNIERRDWNSEQAFHVSYSKDVEGL